MRRQLKLQQQIHTDHLQEALTVKEQEAERNLKRMLNDQAEADSLKYKAQLATIVGRLRGLEAALKSEYIFFASPLPSILLDNRVNSTKGTVCRKRTVFSQKIVKVLAASKY